MEGGKWLIFGRGGCGFGGGDVSLVIRGLDTRIQPAPIRLASERDLNKISRRRLGATCFLLDRSLSFCERLRSCVSI